MDVRGTAPVFIPPAYNPQIPNTPLQPNVPKTTMISSTPSAQERRVGQKIKVAFIITILFILLQLHPVIGFIDRIYGFMFMRTYELGNEYGCITMKGLVFSAILYFIVTLVILRKL